MFYTIFLFQNVYRLLPLGYKNEKIAQSYHFFLRYANILFIFLKKTHPITLNRTIVLFFVPILRIVIGVSFCARVYK